MAHSTLDRACPPGLQALVVATELVEAVSVGIGGPPLEVLAELGPGAGLAGWECAHPLAATGGGGSSGGGGGDEDGGFAAGPRPVLCAEHVTAAAGTGIVHTAPAHGHDDFAVCSAAGITAVDLITDGGAFAAAAGPELGGLPALTKGSAAVVSALEQNGTLLGCADFIHSYPYDWRTKKPVMIRATAQWFADLTEIQPAAIAALADVVIDDRGRKRLESMLAGRKEWCISRQRPWGLPIPAFFDKATGEPLMTEASIQHFEQLVRNTHRVPQRGSPFLLGEAIPHGCTPHARCWLMTMFHSR